MKSEEIVLNEKGKEGTPRIEKLGTMTTSAKGLRHCADYIEKCLKTEGDVQLEHFAAHYPDRVVSGVMINVPKRETNCPECDTELQNSPDGPWCKQCDPDAPTRFHFQESDGH